MPGVVAQICLGGEFLQIVSVAFELCLRIVFQRDSPSLSNAWFRGVWSDLKFLLSGVETFGLPALVAISEGELVAVAFGLSEAAGLCCLLYTSPSPRDQRGSRMPSSA